MKKLADIKQTIVFNAPIEKVWETVSTAEGIASWFMENDFKPEVGHSFYLQSPFGPSPCEVLEVDKPNKIVFSWDTEGWKVHFLLKELGEQTEFTLIHSGWKEADEVVGKANERADIIRERMNNGWTGIINELKKAVEN